MSARALIAMIALAGCGRVRKQCEGEECWRPISRHGAPSPRRAHTAVWTGSEMIVWGGCSEWECYPEALGDGGIYNPEFDTWLPTSSTDAPLGRYSHTAVWVPAPPGCGTFAPEGCMVVWGGFRWPDSEPATIGGLYDPVEDRWVAMEDLGAPMTPRAQHAFLWVPTCGADDPPEGCVVVWGGNGGERYGDGGRYDPRANRWLKEPMEDDGAPTPRSQFSSVWATGCGEEFAPGGCMIVWGGVGAAPEDTGGLYDPVGNQWQAIASDAAPRPRHLHAAVWTGSRMIGWGGAPDFSPSVFSYDPASGAWEGAIRPDGLPKDGQVYASAFWTCKEAIFWGGKDPLGTVNTGGGYNPEDQTWTPIPTEGAPSRRYDHTAVWTGSEMIVWGGADADASSAMMWDNGGRYCAP